MSQTLSSTVYFDNAATTALLPIAYEQLQNLTQNVMGNSASAHRKGRQAQEALDLAHESMGRLFNVPPSHVIFTSGGTESNNLAIWGALGGLVQAFQWIKSGGQGKVLTSTIEHPATAKVFESLQGMGASVGWLKVDREGLIDLTSLHEALEEGSRVKFVSLHHAQNEIGVLQDIAAISRIIRAKNPDTIIHIDAVQSFLKTQVDFDSLGVDMISISGHKVGAPKGIGALVLGRRFENRNPKIGAFLQGSTQQFGIRPGTVPVPSIGALIAAVEWGAKNMAQNRARLLELRARLTSQLPKQVIVNGPADLSPENPRRVPQTVNFSVPGLPSAVTVEALSAQGFCISSGAACHSTNPKPNETLMTMGVGRERALSAVRVSFSPQNTIDEVDRFIVALDETIRQYA